MQFTNTSSRDVEYSSTNHNTCESQVTEIEHIGYVFIIPAICIIGIVCNILNLVVLNRLPSHALSYKYLTALAVVDLITMIFVIPIGFSRCRFCHVYDDVGYARRFYEIYIYLPISNISSTTSVWITVAMAVDRFLFVCHPIKYKAYSYHFAKLLTMCCILATGFNIPYFFKYKIAPCNAKKLSNYGDSIYFEIFSWVKAVFVKILPVLCLSVLNSLLINAMWTQCTIKPTMLVTQEPSPTEQRRTKQQNKLTWTLIGTVFVFLVGNIPIIFAFRGISKHLFGDVNTKVFSHFKLLANVLEILSFAVNFFIYITCDKRFLRTLQRTFRCEAKYDAAAGATRYQANNFNVIARPIH